MKSRYRGQPAYLKADKAATWELVAQVMSALGDAGIQVNAVTQPEDSADKRGRGWRLTSTSSTSFAVRSSRWPRSGRWCPIRRAFRGRPPRGRRPTRVVFRW